MRDPFPFPPPTALVNLVKPIADRLDLPTLPLHAHEILLATAFYTVLYSYISPLLSSYIFPRIYPKLSANTRINWDVHVVALVQALIVDALAIWLMLADTERNQLDVWGRLWGYSGAGGLTQAFAAGYFLWDFWTCLRYVHLFGPGMLAHAISALAVFSLGFRPFVNYYCPTFVFYELSSPFLNIHWFLDKCGKTGSRIQLYNGILLLSTFFGARLLWGTYQSLRVYQDVWAGVHFDTADPNVDNNILVQAWRNGTAGTGDMRFATGENVPDWLGAVYLGSNLVLNALNYYWFGAMVRAVRKRFEPKKGSKGAITEEEEEKPIVEGVELDIPDADIAEVTVDTGADVLEVEQSEIRRRHVA